MGICVTHQTSPTADTVSKTSEGVIYIAPQRYVTKSQDNALLTTTPLSPSTSAPFTDYNYDSWSSQQREKMLFAQEGKNSEPYAQRSPSISILQRISLHRLSASREESPLDDLQPKKENEDGCTAGNGPSIGARGRRLSRTLNDVHLHLNATTPRRSGEDQERYLKRVFTTVDSEGKGRVSITQLADALSSNANCSSMTVMMDAADHDKDGYLSESEFVSFFIHVEREVDCLQADRNEDNLIKLNSASEMMNASTGFSSELATRQYTRKAAHPLAGVSSVRMRGVEVINLPSQSCRIKCIALSPGGDLYAVSHRHDNIMHIYTINNSREVQRLLGHKKSLLGVVFSPDRKHIVTASRDCFVASWDHTLGLECTFSEHPGIVTAVAVSFDGKFIFSGCQDNRVRKMTASRAKVLAVLPCISGDTPGVIVGLSAQKTKNDLIALSRSCDRCAYIASFRDLKMVARLRGHESMVWQTSFNADDSMLFTCCVQKIILWNRMFSSVRVFNSAAVATPGSSVVEVLWTTAVFAALEHRGLLVCFNSARQMHILNCESAKAGKSILDIQMHSNVYAVSAFVGDTMVCGDDCGNVYRVRIT